MKLFPFILVGLFLARRQYRAFAVACITAVLSTVAALWLIDPDILESLVGDLGALAHFGNHYVSQIRPLEVGFDHSLYSGIKSVIVPLLPGAYWNLLTVAYMTVAAVGGSLLFFTVIRKLPFLNQVICLSVAAIVLPPVSYDYTLIHLYTPFALLLLFVLDQAHEANDPSRLAPGVAAALALFAFLFSVQSEFIFHGVRYAGQLKTVVLLCLGYVALRYPFTLKRSLDAQLLA